MSRLLAAQRAFLVPAWGRDSLYRRARAVPSLDQAFAEDRSLSDRISGRQLITFTRSTTATYINSSGNIVTAAINEPRFTHDPVIGRCLGVIREEQRTQLLELSDALATQTKTVTAVAHTFSFYGTGSVVLSGAHSATVSGSGAYPARTTLTFTPSAGSLTLTVTGTVQYGQLEVGSTATSYIPNTGTSQVTRAADVISISGSALSGWFNPSESTCYIEFLASLVSSATAAPFSFNDSTASNRISAFCTASNFLCARNTGGAGVFFAPSTPYAPALGVNKLAVSFASFDFALTGNGGVVVTATNYGVPAITALNIGSQLNDLSLNGVISRLIYVPKRLSNTVIQDLTR